MPGWNADLLKPADAWDDIPVPREGTNVTAVRDDPQDGPVRPGFQTLANQAFWLRVGIVEGQRTLASAHLAKVGGARPSSAGPGELLVEAGAQIRENCKVGGSVFAGDEVRAGTFISAKIGGSAILFWRTGLEIGGPNITVLQDQIQWGHLPLGMGNPPRGTVLRNALSAKQVIKAWGVVRIQAGTIVDKEGVGGWDASLVVVPGAPEGNRCRITWVAAEKMDSSRYLVVPDLLTPAGSSGLLKGKIVEKNLDFFDIAGWNLIPSGGGFVLSQIDFAAVSSMEVGFFVLGVQS